MGGGRVLHDDLPTKNKTKEQQTFAIVNVAISLGLCFGPLTKLAIQVAETYLLAKRGRGKNTIDRQQWMAG
jgi:hypothetical protein